MKKLIDKLEKYHTERSKELNYNELLENWLFHGNELSVGDFVCSTSSDLNDYFDKFARTYLNHDWQNDVLNFGGSEEDVYRARQDIAKRTWEQIKEDAEEE